MSPKTVPQPAPTLTKRPPVVVIMGHVDHGKSTLLDYIRRTKVAAGEAGGITQHIGAYEVEHPKGKITFLDTPGHEAFSSIRERGARAADIAVLVVSAEDGVKPQTLEALKCILAEKIPYIVAINKIDKPGANVEVTKQSLAEHEIYVEGYGGDIPVVPISAVTGAGITELLEMIMLVAELANLEAATGTAAEGVVIESYRDSKKGISATLLIKNGTLESGHYVVAGNAFSPVRILEDFQGKKVKTATFSSPVRVIGFDTIPVVGAPFVVCENKREAEELVRKHVIATKTSQPKSAAGQASAVVTLPIILKADVIGSLEGVKHEFKKINQDKVQIKIVAESIGDINENDVKMAQTSPESGIMIVAFNSHPDAKAQAIIERTAVRVESFNIIYKLAEFMKEAVAAKVPKEYIDQVSGSAKILAVFSKNKDKQILGGKVQEGSLTVGSEVKIIRREAEIGRGKIKELQLKKVKASEVNEGYEFGCLVESKVEIAEGDRLQGFITVEKK